MSAELRERLKEVTSMSVGDQPSALSRLSASIPNGIKIVCGPIPLDSYTCGVYAFHLVGDHDYEEIARQDSSTFAGEKFVHFLIDRGWLNERSQSDESEGDLIIYFRDGRFAHVGLLLASGRVCSKWGTGHIYEHGRWEVPQSYGAEARVFSHPGREECRAYFLCYARKNGFSEA